MLQRGIPGHAWRPLKDPPRPKLHGLLISGYSGIRLRADFTFTMHYHDGFFAISFQVFHLH